MKRLLGLVLAGLLVLGVLSAPAGADDTVKVWTQNMYIGADLTPVLAATTPEDFFKAARDTLEQMGANFFPLRAQRLATEIALYEPDLIALQEVEDISLDGNYPGPPFVDYLQSLLNALELRGQRYKVAAVVVNLSLEVTIAPYGLVKVVDRDVILVREGVTASPLTLCSQTSGTGCNYSTFASLPSPLPPPAPESINVNRGYVGVDALVRGKRVFFVTTHLEQRVLTPEMPETAAIQSGQAAELAGVLDVLANENPGVPIILAGDFNSSPEDVQTDGIIPPYLTISGSGFTDSWKRNPLALFDPKGYTCCQNEYLNNKTSELYERIDIVFIRGGRFLPWELVTTRVPLIFPAPHWASDHGGVFAKLTFK